ncbi:hypothetical protein BDV38DRAFT_183169 [Aspergillus pseudotamarii]|uniref:Uncharacterized protein n=1 Tax=Aspergillus pseudotamarii TaxID=132259 RepID=A0A5N6SJF3_ASPPS|nr:uncharacterized protein BDV38DRAFT_183169 [Aspergillus pseudotamarii]KAE8133513.1 hypothetical protein BDV38DRAFT_183169 [Aspergillus pseudotamarii]
MDLDVIDNGVKYNEILTQVCILITRTFAPNPSLIIWLAHQISVNLTNALTTFGSSSKQYQTVLEILKDCLRNIESDRKKTSLSLDPDTLSLAMGFLDIGK